MDRRLLVEPLGAVEEYLPLLTEAERREAAAFGTERRREYFAWRALVRRELGLVAIAYDPAGAPLLPDHPQIHISVSHGAGRVAVCLSDRRCAVDIEALGRNFGRVRSRYLTPAEQALSADPRFEAVAWCAKECLYKIAGVQELDLLSDLRITDAGADWIAGNIKNGAPRRFSVRYYDDAVIVWSL